MQHVSSLNAANLSRPSVVTIGAFDGVHRGHQWLIHQLVKYAAERAWSPVVLTFFPHPEMVLRGFRPNFYLTLPDEKARLLGELGVKVVITHPFDYQVRHIRAAEFVDRLLGGVNMASLWIGEDFAMGYQREGNVDFLRKQATERGFELRVVDLMDAGGERVSSTRVRGALAWGDVTEAARLLGRSHGVPGEVVQGAGRGRTIGIPTANLSVPEELAIPSRGVYAGWMDVDGTMQPAVVNIGLRPTFDGAGAQTVEAHLLDFSKDLYGQHVNLYFAARLRDEQKFSGIDALVAQIHADIDRARALLSETPGPFVAR